MIQRIQTVWLILASLALFALFIFPYANTAPSSQNFVINVYGISQYQQHDNELGQIETSYSFGFVMMAIYTLLIALLPLYTVFKYTHRQLQLRLSYLGIFLGLLLIIWMYLSAKSILNETGMTLQISHMALGTFLVPINIIFLFMAAQGIKKDVSLLKSAERLR